MVLVHHMRKPDGRDGEDRMPGKYDFIGSSHLVNVAHAILLCWHNKKKAAEKASGQPVEDDKPDYVVHVAKQRAGRFEGRVGLYQHPTCRAFCSTPHRKVRLFSTVTGWQ